MYWSRGRSSESVFLPQPLCSFLIRVPHKPLYPSQGKRGRKVLISGHSRPTSHKSVTWPPCVVRVIGKCSLQWAPMCLAKYKKFCYWKTNIDGLPLVSANLSCIYLPNQQLFIACLSYVGHCFYTVASNSLMVGTYAQRKSHTTLFPN